MRRIAIAGLAAGTALAFAPGALAAPSPTGQRCAFVGATDPQLESSVTGALAAGPLALGDDADPAAVYTGSVTCTVQVNGPTHAHADGCAVTGPVATGAVGAQGTCTASFVPGDLLYVCTQVQIAGGPVLYYDEPNDPVVDGGWTTDPHAACALQPEPVPGVGGTVEWTEEQAAALATALTETADGAVRTVGDFHPGFPPAGFTLTSVAWRHVAGAALPTFTPPDPAASHPAYWTCTTSYPSPTTARAVCTPDPGQEDPGTAGWSCYDPFVVADVNAPLLVAAGVTGRSSCGTTVARCTASTAAAPAGYCQQAAFPHQPVPLVCEADFAAAPVVANWAVRCAPVDP